MGNNEARSEEWLKKGLSYKENSDLGLSISCFSEAIRLNPDSCQAWYEQGLAYSACGAHTKAIVNFSKTIELEDAALYSSALYERGKEYLAVGKFFDAADDLLIEDFEPDSPVIELIEQAAGGLLETGDFDGAIWVIRQLKIRAEWDHAHEDYFVKQAIEKRTEYELVKKQFTGLTPVEDRKADFISIEDLKKSAREEEEGTYSSLNLLAKALKENADSWSAGDEQVEDKKSEEFGFLAQAISDFNFAISLHSEDEDALEFRAFAYLKVVWSEKQIDSEYDCEDLCNLAIEDCNAAIRVDPKRATVWSNKADAYAEKGDHIEALKNYDEAIRLAPKDSGHYWARSRTHTALGNTSEAAADDAMFTQLIREDMWGEVE